MTDTKPLKLAVHMLLNKLSFLNPIYVWMSIFWNSFCVSFSLSEPLSKSWFSSIKFENTHHPNTHDFFYLFLFNLENVTHTKPDHIHLPLIHPCSPQHGPSQLHILFIYNWQSLLTAAHVCIGAKPSLMHEESTSGYTFKKVWFPPFQAAINHQRFLSKVEDWFPCHLI